LLIAEIPIHILPANSVGMKKILYATGAVLLIIILANLTQYHADIPLDELKPAFAPAPSKFMMMDGATVHYRDEGKGFPVVLVHGMSSSLHTWQGWTDILSKQYRVIRFDLPGFGLTGPNANNDYSIEYYENFVQRFLDSLGVTECYMAGNSLGGFITWNYALHHPRQVKKIILLDAAGYPMKTPPFVASLGRSKLMSPIMRYITPRFIVAGSIKQVYGDDSKITDGDIERYFKLTIRAGNRAAFISFVNQFREHDTIPIQQITTPTLIEWGEKDRWIPVDNAYRFKRDIKDSKLVVYRGVGHIPMEEIPAQSCIDALKFFARAPDTVNPDSISASEVH
jgi:pimeloyl-ACP methyl ester carboxylesterase